MIRSEIQNLLIQELIDETPTTTGVSNNATSSTEFSTDIPTIIVSRVLPEFNDTIMV